MIGYLEGTLLKKKEDRILLLAGPVGYEVLLPAVVMASLQGKGEGDRLFFHIYHYQTERQPKPVLIGFNTEEEKDFFHLLTTVEAIGPLKAVQCLTLPIGEVAEAIETGNSALLGRLKGVGGRTAQKMIATLKGKVGRFADAGHLSAPDVPVTGTLADQTVEVLVGQLGYKPNEARLMVAGALKRNPDVSSPEALFDEIFKHGQAR
ncbi:MAG: Holliday junction branch migration protein RuvA [Thermodesulfobacteriota bacterium]|nr:Holliday junction branch migration protein RuvA [Thermodesulfobacteriota bacterium]